MKTIDLIMKHKLWSVMKYGNMNDLDTSLENHIYYNAKTAIIDEIKTDDMLERFLHNYLMYSYEYRHEKKMFNYLSENISQEKFNEIVKKHDINYLLSNWIKRNSNKKPFFKFLEIFDQQELENGKLLYNATGASNQDILEYAINKNKSETYPLTEEIKINFLTDRRIKGDLKVKLWLNYKSSIESNLMSYFFDSIRNEDEIATNWLIKNYYKEMNKNERKSSNYISLQYNKITQKLLQQIPEILIEKDNEFTSFHSNLFEKMLKYKTEIENLTNPLQETCEEFKTIGIIIPKTESNSIIFKNITYENMDYLCHHSIFKMNMKNLTCINLFQKLCDTAPQDKFNSALELVCKKLDDWNVKFDENESQTLLLDYGTYENMDYLISQPIFTKKITEVKPVSLFKKLYETIPDENNNMALEIVSNKLKNWGMSLDEEKSHILFLEYATSENFTFFLNHPIFNCNKEALLIKTWRKNGDMGGKLAQLVDKEVLWKLSEMLNPMDKSQFELDYYENKFENKAKEKRMKI